MMKFKDLLPNSGNTAKLLAEDFAKYAGQVLMGTRGGKEASRWFRVNVGDITPATRATLSFVLRTMAYAPRQIAIMNVTRFFNLRPDVVARVTHEGFDTLIETILELLGVPDADRGSQGDRVQAIEKILEKRGNQNYAVLLVPYRGKAIYEVHALDCSTVIRDPAGPTYVDDVRIRTLEQILEIDPEAIEIPPCCAYELPEDVRAFFTQPPASSIPEPSKTSEKKGGRPLDDVLADMGRAFEESPEGRCARFYEDLMRVAGRLVPLEDDCKAISKCEIEPVWTVQSFLSLLNRAIGIERDGSPTSVPGLPVEPRYWPQPVLAMAVASLRRVMENHIEAHESQEPLAIASRVAKKVGNVLILRGPEFDEARDSVSADAQRRRQSAADIRQRTRDRLGRHR